MDHDFRERGVNVRIFEPVAILNAPAITLANHIILSEFLYLAGGRSTYVGNFVHLAAHSSISGGGVAILEDFVGVAAGARLITGNEDWSGRTIPTPTLPPELAHLRAPIRSFIHCERHSFIATNAVVQPGVRIGEGAIVGSGSVVTKDLDPWGIYLGIPARRVRDRSSREVIAQGEIALTSCGIKRRDLSEWVRLCSESVKTPS